MGHGRLRGDSRRSSMVLFFLNHFIFLPDNNISTSKHLLNSTCHPFHHVHVRIYIYTLHKTFIQRIILQVKKINGPGREKPDPEGKGFLSININ